MDDDDTLRSQSEDNYDEKIKIMLIGESKIGKTSSGKYIVLHNVSSRYSDDGHFVVWEATVNDNSKIELTLRKSHKRLDMLGRKLVIMKKE